jgi:protein-S-isoprenylcysteine O-methyltransferase Ste14
VTDGTRAPVREIGDDATAEVAERAREQLWTASVTCTLYVAGAAVLFMEPWAWSAAEAWWGPPAFLLVILGALLWRFGTERGRAGQAGRLLSEYAVLRHADPGPGRRAPADEVARGFVRGERLLGWLYGLGVVAFAVTAGQWDRPGWAIPGAMLLGSAAVILLFAVERQARAGRRWLADPPGPPRD